MRRTRIYCNSLTAQAAHCTIDGDAHHHIVNVLRMKTDDELFIFNGNGLESRTKIVDINKKYLTVTVIETLKLDTESPLMLTLAQCIAKKDKMDWLIQKACELGVHSITPIISEYCQAPPKADLQQKRLQHWQKIMINACEQCGRNRLPTLHSFIHYEDYIKQQDAGLTFLLHPDNKTQTALPEALKQATILIGPEGGFSQREITLANKLNIQGIQLGPRILRTETAALTAISLFQSRFGDLGEL